MQRALHNAAHLHRQYTLETAKVPSADACCCGEAALQVQYNMQKLHAAVHLDAGAAAAEQAITCNACPPPEDGRLPAGLQACACCWSGSLQRCSPPQSLVPPCSLHCHYLQMPPRLQSFRAPLQACCTGEGCSLDGSGVQRCR